MNIQKQELDEKWKYIGAIL